MRPETEDRVFQALDSARRVGWAKYYDTQKTAEWLEDSLRQAMLMLISAKRVQGRGYRIWQWMDAQGVNPDFVIEILKRYDAESSDDLTGWFLDQRDD